MQYELYHHGILGMKWGIRRYQNKDGSLTAAGRKRYGISKEANNILKSVSKRDLLFEKAAGTYGKKRSDLGDKIRKENATILRNVLSKDSEDVQAFRQTLNQGRELSKQKEALLEEIYNDPKQLDKWTQEYVNWSWDRKPQRYKDLYESKEQYFEEFNREKDGSIDAHDDLLSYIVSTDPRIKPIEDSVMNSYFKALNNDLPKVVESVMGKARNLPINSLPRNNRTRVESIVKSIAEDKIYMHMVDDVPIDYWLK